MQASSGEDYEENQWGFGQISIMMMWLPLVQDAIVIWWEPCADGRRQPEDDASAETAVTAQTESSSTTTARRGNFKPGASPRVDLQNDLPSEPQWDVSSEVERGLAAPPGNVARHTAPYCAFENVGGLVKRSPWGLQIFQSMALQRVFGASTCQLPSSAAKEHHRLNPRDIWSSSCAPTQKTQPGPLRVYQLLGSRRRLGQSANDAAAMSDPLVQQCRNVCILLYGSGNPDITGIGAMICYHIQGILVFLAGPLLRNILALRGRDAFRRVSAGENSNLLSRVFALSELTHNKSILLAVPIAVAAAVRVSEWRQIPVTELKLLRDLVRYEYLVCLVSLSSLTITPAPSTRLRRSSIILGSLLVVFHAGLEGAESVATGSAGGSAVIVNGLLNSFTYRHGFSDLETTFRSTGPWISGTVWAQFALYSYLPPSFMWIWQMVYAEELSEDAASANATWFSAPLTKLSAALAVPIYFPAWDPRAGWVLVKPEERLPLLLGPTSYQIKLFREVMFQRRDRIARFILGVCSLGEAALHILWLDYLTLARIRAGRRDTQDAVGEEYEENRWGFGQVTIMMMWLPWLQEVVFFIWDFGKIKRNGPWWRDRAQHGDGRDVSVELQDVPTSRASDGASQTEQEATPSGSVPRPGLTARTTFARNAHGGYLPRSRND
ncbi:hypothetical protein CPLU01_10457 [Colletotrichum plurivorum]|uniref:Uncharacterized protein n=1 Tax=Colletotrichum plurivorum TaxID=2175906 RepID=A0A8H6N9H9_9PEZI|nr:hypothetical protein CPLU01_10457 [Colletotrichum plurivorum]